MKAKYDWIVSCDGSAKPMGHECLRCGAYHKIETPVKIDKFLKIANAFINLHKLCKKK